MLREKNMEAAVTTIDVDTTSPVIDEESISVDTYLKDEKYNSPVRAKKGL